MSRSYKKLPITSNTKNESDKSFKKSCSKSFRKRSNNLITKISIDNSDESLILPEKKLEILDVTSYPKDGKQYITRDEVRSYIESKILDAKLNKYRKSRIIVDGRFANKKPWIEYKNTIFYGKNTNETLLTILKINKEKDLFNISEESLLKAVDYLYNNWAFNK